MAHILKIAAASFIFWCMVIMTLDIMNLIDVELDAPYVIELLHSVPKLLSIVNDANASNADMISSSIPAELPFIKMKITILPDLS